MRRALGALLVVWLILASAVPLGAQVPTHDADDEAEPAVGEEEATSPAFGTAALPEAADVLVAVGAAPPPELIHVPTDAVVGGAVRDATSGWVVTATGAVRSYGGAPHHGDVSHLDLTEPIVAMEATPGGEGYWLVASDGGVFALGDAGFHGSTGDIRLNRPIVDMAAAADGEGYLIAADDGGLFAFGSARFLGSMGDVPLNEPVVGLSRTSSGEGYWLVARDGGIFAFGDAEFRGSTGADPPSAPVIDIVETPDRNGYWLVTEAGEIHAFGTAEPFASPDADADVGGAVVGASRQGDGLWLTVHPRVPTIYAWQSGGLTDEVADAVVGAATQAGAVSSVTHLGTLGVHQFRRGSWVYQSTAPGWRIAFTARAVDPEVAAVFHGGDVAAALQRGQVVLSRRSADLRDARVGDTIVFHGWDGRLHERTVGAIIPDSRVSSTELTFGVEDARRFGFVRPASIWIAGMGDVEALTAELDALVAAETWVRWSASWAVGSAATDSTLSTVRLKELLGEFSYRFAGGVSIEIEPRWVEANIVAVDLPILGRWRCHRRVIPDLVAALRAVEEAGLGHLVDPVDSRWGGCWVARRIRGSSGGAVSRHAWGLAVDINPSTNPWGQPPTMDMAVVEIFRAHGFAWGGTWTRPDGMHFEWVGR